MTTTTTGRPASPGATRRAAAQRRRARRTRRRVAWAAAALIVVAGLVGLVIVLAGGSEGQSEEDESVLELSLGDYFIGGDLTVEAGRVQLEATNVGREPHDVGIVGGKISTTLFSGQSATLDLGELAPGTYQLYCDVGDHQARGMVATLTVTDRPPS